MTGQISHLFKRGLRWSMSDPKIIYDIVFEKSGIEVVCQSLILKVWSSNPAGHKNNFQFDNSIFWFDRSQHGAVKAIIKGFKEM